MNSNKVPASIETRLAVIASTHSTENCNSSDNAGAASVPPQNQGE